MATIVAFHAHPDDEVLLTGGTIAWLAAGGHRVIIVVACDGDMWAGPDQGRRLDQLRLLTRYRLEEMRGYGTPRSAITHRVDVRRHAAQKRAALMAHQTQVSGRGRSARLFRVLVRVPLPVYRVVCGTEWFTEPGGRTGELVARDQATVPGRPDEHSPGPR